MKKLCSIIIATIVSASCLISCDKGNSSTNNIGDAPIWGTYTESAECIVYEMFNYDMPIVRTPDGQKELPVKVTVKDAAGNELDSTGGFFAVRELTEYTIIYSVEYNGKTYTKTTTVTSIPKVEYTLHYPESYELFIYDKGDEVDLKEILTASLDKPISYSVNHDGQAVEVADGKFTVADVGAYDVVASMKNQEDCEFRIYSVDAAELDTTVYIPTDLNEVSLYNPDGAACTLSMTDEKTYGENEYSVKLAAPNSHTRQIGVTFATAKSIENYVGLAMEGYNYVAYYFQYDLSMQQNNGLKIFADGIASADTKVQLVIRDSKGEVTHAVTADTKVLTEDKYYGWNTVLPSTGWCELRVPLATWLANFDGDTMISFAPTYNHSLNYYFGGCEVVKVHEHTYSNTWSSDDTHHWKAATCEHTDEIGEQAEHSYSAPDYTCVCGKVHTHTYANTLSHDNTNHWYASTCGHSEIVSGKGTHVYAGTDGDCVCGAINPQHTHTFASEWSKDGAYHWKAATCGHDEVVNEKDVHNYIDGVCACGAIKAEAKPNVVYTSNTIGLAPQSGNTDTPWGTVTINDGGKWTNWGTASLDTEKTYGTNSTSIKVAFTGNLNLNTLTLSFDALYGKDVYEMLAEEGYNYVSYYFQYENVNNENSAQFYVFANGYNSDGLQVYHLTYDDLDTNRNSMRASSSAIFWGSGNEGSYNSQGTSGQIGTQGKHSSTNWCEIRVPIDRWLADFNGVCSIGFKAGNTNMPSDTVVWFGGCELVKVN